LGLYQHPYHFDAVSALYFLSGHLLLFQNA
jgi:hypothetical protein